MRIDDSLGDIHDGDALGRLCMLPDGPNAVWFSGIAHEKIGNLAIVHLRENFEGILRVADLAPFDLSQILSGHASHFSGLLLAVASEETPLLEEMFPALTRRLSDPRHIAVSQAVSF